MSINEAKIKALKKKIQILKIQTKNNELLLKVLEDANLETTS